MTAQVMRKGNKVKRNIKRAARIKFELKLRGLKFVDIAEDLDITPQAVWNSVYGVNRVTRVDLWLERNIGHDFYDYNSGF